MNGQMQHAEGAGEALALLYDLSPHECEFGRAAVLTVTPQCWEDAGPHATVFDLSDLVLLPEPYRSVAPLALDMSAPQTVDELCTSIAALAPRSVVVDSSIMLSRVLNRWVPGWADRVGWVAELAERLPAGVGPGDEREIDAMGALLAWAVTIPSLTALTAVVTTGIASHPDYSWLRDHVRGHQRLCAALELPTGLFTSIKLLSATVLYLGGSRDRTHVDKVEKVADLALPAQQPWFERLRSWLREGEECQGFLIQLDGDLPWSRETVVDRDQLRERLQRLGPVETLGELCEVRHGKRIKQDQVAREGGIPLVRRSTLTNAFLDLENAQRVPPDGIAERYYLRPGDILLSTAITGSSAAVLYTRTEPAVFEEGVIRIRGVDSRVDTEYLLEYLNSTTSQTMVSSLATTDSWLGSRHISAPGLRQLLVPLIEPGLVSGMAELGRTESALRHKADELRDQRSQLFEAPNAIAFRRDVLDLKRRGNLFARGIERADSIEYQIANFYPFPLAFSYRSLTGDSDVADRYREQLRVAEDILAFLGSLVLALIAPEHREEAGIDIRGLWRSGISPGDWKDVIIRGASVFRRYEYHPLADALVELNIGSGKGFGGDIAQLISAKNDFKHDRGPIGTQEVEEASEAVHAALGRCMERLAFFTDFPLRYVRSINRVRHVGWALEYTGYVGDHPALPSGHETVAADSPLRDLIPEELHVVLAPDRWATLHPFVSIHTCPHCKSREVFFLDRWNERKGIVRLKSFERGHTEDDAQIERDLTDWQRAPVATGSAGF